MQSLAVIVVAFAGGQLTVLFHSFCIYIPHTHTYGYYQRNTLILGAMRLLATMSMTTTVETTTSMMTTAEPKQKSNRYNFYSLSPSLFLSPSIDICTYTNYSYNTGNKKVLVVAHTTHGYSACT